MQSEVNQNDLTHFQIVFDADGKTLNKVTIYYDISIHVTNNMDLWMEYRSYCIHQNT